MNPLIGFYRGPGVRLDEYNHLYFIYISSLVPNVSDSSEIDGKYILLSF
jgi:hypothetical protein